MGTGPVEAVEVTDLVADLQRLATRLDPDQIADGDVAGVMADLGQVKRLVDGMLTLMARRTIDIAPAGRRQVAEARRQVAEATGTTDAEARRLVDTSIRLRDQAPIADAVRDGRLSAGQAEAVSDAAVTAPDQTHDLLGAAARQTLNGLKTTCRDAKAKADPDPADTRRRHHRSRGFRSWTESDGEWKAFLSATADDGARIDAALRAGAHAHFMAANAAGQHEPDKAYRFDAFMDLVTGTATTAGTTGSATTNAGSAGSAETAGSTPTPTARPTGASRGRQTRARQTKVIITVDAAALNRSHARPGETCDIAGVGRVPVEAVKALIPDAHLAYVIRDAEDVAVAHLGRQVTAHQRTALEARGYECEVPDCRTQHLLEIDHVTGWAINRQTRLDDLAWLCRRHHRDKTAGTHHLTGPPGDRRWHTVGDAAPERADGVLGVLRALGPVDDRVGHLRGHPIRVCGHRRRSAGRDDGRGDQISLFAGAHHRDHALRARGWRDEGRSKDVAVDLGELVAAPDDT